MAIVLQIRRLQSRVFSSSNNRHLNNTHSKKGVGFTDALFCGCNEIHLLRRNSLCSWTNRGNCIKKTADSHESAVFRIYGAFSRLNSIVLIRLWRSMQKERRFYRRSFCVFCAVNVRVFFVNQLAEFYSYFSFPASDGFPSVL